MMMKILPLLICSILLSVVSVSAAERALRLDKQDRPNILFIMTDQHFADAMSGVMGDRYVKTPHLDALAASGIRFDRAYAPNPI